MMPSFEEDMGEENVRKFKLTGQAVKGRGLSALEAVWQKMPWGTEIEIEGGEQATIVKFIEPRIKDDSTHFYFDVRDTHGDWHLEIKVEIAGWGGKPIGEMTLPAKE